MSLTIPKFVCCDLHPEHNLNNLTLELDGELVISLDRHWSLILIVDVTLGFAERNHALGITDKKLQNALVELKVESPIVYNDHYGYKACFVGFSDVENPLLKDPDKQVMLLGNAIEWYSDYCRAADEEDEQ